MVKPKRRQRASGTLIAWISIGVVVAVVLTVVLVKTLQGSSPPQTNKFGLTTPTVFHEVTNVPTSVFNTIGVTSPTISVVPGSVFGVLKDQPKLIDKASGLPLAFYWGAEFCPYCAATRWGIIIALSRFGTFDKLYNMLSSATDPAGPNTPTFTFDGVTYTSPYLAFKGYEVEDRNGKTLMTPPHSINQLVAHYNQSGTFPFMDIANHTFIRSSAFDPLQLAGYTTQSSIASGLTDTSSPVTQAIITTANYVSAGICASAKNPPAAVCTSPGVQAAAHALGLTL